MRKKAGISNKLPILYRIIIGIFVFLGALIMLLPLVNTLALSFSTTVGSMAPGIRLIPDQFSTEGYYIVWSTAKLYRAFFNSVFVTFTGTAIEMFLACLAGYVLIQKGMPFQKAIVSFVMLTMMVPPDLTLISIYAINKQLNLLNSYAGLIVNGLVYGISILLMRNYFLAIPESLAESARIDNASEFRIFWGMYIPLSIPGLAAVSFLEFVRRWNLLMIPVTIVTKEEFYTLPVLLKSLIYTTTTTSGTTFIGPNAVAAAIIISIFPLVVLYAFAQKFFISGLTLGATKG